MGRNAYLLMFGAAAAVTAVTVYTWSGDSTGEGLSTSPLSMRSRATASMTGPAGAPLRAESDAVPEAVPKPRGTQASLSREIGRPAAGPTTAAPVQKDAAAKVDAESDDSVVADREMSKLASRCDTMISGESIDPEWSRAKYERFGAFFERPVLAGTTLRSMDCRTTMCRVDLAHRSNEDRERFIEHFSDLAGPEGMVFAHIETADDLDVVVFVTRDRVGLP